MFQDIYSQLYLNIIPNYKKENSLKNSTVDIYFSLTDLVPFVKHKLVIKQLNLPLDGFTLHAFCSFCSFLHLQMYESHKNSPVISQVIQLKYLHLQSEIQLPTKKKKKLKSERTTSSSNAEAPFKLGKFKH